MRRDSALATRCTGSVEHLADGVSMTAVALGEFADLGTRQVAGDEFADLLGAKSALDLSWQRALVVWSRRSCHIEEPPQAFYLFTGLVGGGWNNISLPPLVVKTTTLGLLRGTFTCPVAR